MNRLALWEVPQATKSSLILKEHPQSHDLLLEFHKTPEGYIYP